MSSPRMLRASITEAEHNEIRKLALDKRIATADLVAQALRTAPVTKRAFQPKETK